MRERALYAALALAFAASVAGTIGWCRAMPVPDCMTMPGMEVSMAWLRMPGQGWLEAAASFVAMWSVMMMAMMLPSLVLVRGRVRSVAQVAGYFFVWVLAGIAVYPLGVLATEATMRDAELAAVAPLIAGAVVLLAGLFQFSCWKAKYLDCCRATHSVPPNSIGEALRQGMRLGTHCIACCGNLMMVLLVLGVMDLVTMAFVTVAITLERVAGEWAAHGVGVAVIAAAVVLVGRAAGW